MAYFKALVVKHNNDTYINKETLKIGSVQTIPTPEAGGRLDGDFWAVPVNNYGIVDDFDFIVASPTDVVPPTSQAFHVFRLLSDHTDDVWWVAGTSSLGGGSPAAVGYAEVANDWECCAAVKGSLPFTTTAPAPCVELCFYNGGTSYGATWTLPALVGNQRYYAYGYYNNNTLTALTPSTGFATAGALLTAIQTNWGTAGTPAQTVGTWTSAVSATGSTTLTLTQAAGASGYNVVCVCILAVNPSAS